MWSNMSDMSLALTALLLSLSMLEVSAYVKISFPTQGSTVTAGQDVYLAWSEDDILPTLAQLGSFEIYLCKASIKGDCDYPLGVLAEDVPATELGAHVVVDKSLAVDASDYYLRFLPTGPYSPVDGVQFQITGFSDAGAQNYQKYQFVPDPMPKSPLSGLGFQRRDNAAKPTEVLVQAPPQASLDAWRSYFGVTNPATASVSGQSGGAVPSTLSYAATATTAGRGTTSFQGLAATTTPIATFTPPLTSGADERFRRPDASGFGGLPLWYRAWPFLLAFYLTF